MEPLGGKRHGGPAKHFQLVVMQPMLLTWSIFCHLALTECF